MAIFEAWENSETVMFATSENIKIHRMLGLLCTEATHLHSIEALSYCEAMTAHHKCMGWAPYDQVVRTNNKVVQIKFESAVRGSLQ